MRLALIVEYEGTEYHGFQYQPNATSIQEELEKAIERLTGQTVRINGAGRTDAGVHAEGQVVAFNTDARHPAETFTRALNHFLPDDIAVIETHRVAPEFDPRRHALSRSYRYTILNRPAPAPLLRRSAYHVPAPLDVVRMDLAARRFLGVHDFSRFAGPLEDPSASTERRVMAAGVHRAGDRVVFEIRGSSFLPHQVRRMAGALLDVGKGVISIENLDRMILARKCSPVAHNLPPQGLSLISVSYDGFPPGEQPAGRCSNIGLSQTIQQNRAQDIGE